MKNRCMLLLAAVLAAGSLAGCRRSPIVPMDTTVPLATVKPTAPTTDPTAAPTDAPRPGVGTYPTEGTVSPTIEDGNGLTPSQRSMGLFH